MAESTETQIYVNADFPITVDDARNQASAEVGGRRVELLHTYAHTIEVHNGVGEIVDYMTEWTLTFGAV